MQDIQKHYFKFGSSSSISILGMVPHFTENIGCPHEATALRLPQLLLNNEATSMRLPQLILIRLLLRQPQKNVLTSNGLILFWFLTHPHWFHKPACVVWDNCKLFSLYKWKWKWTRREMAIRSGNWVFHFRAYKSCLQIQNESKRHRD